MSLYRKLTTKKTTQPQKHNPGKLTVQNIDSQHQNLKPHLITKNKELEILLKPVKNRKSKPQQQRDWLHSGEDQYQPPNYPALESDYEDPDEPVLAQLSDPQVYPLPYESA